MNKMQKEFIKKWIKGITLFLLGVALTTCLVLGEPWQWITLGVLGVICLVCILVAILEIIGSAIWHWRLMGECKTKWEEDTLRYWWLFMNYHSGNWEEFIPRMIDKEYKDEYHRQKAFELFNRFKAVKPPKMGLRGK